MKRTLSKALTLVSLLSVALALSVATAAAAPENPQLTLEAPNSANLGDVLSLKARLLDASGKPIADATVNFTMPSTFFLGATSDVVIARINTDQDGWATTDYRVTSSGSVAIRAEFRGNDRFAAAKSDASMQVEGGPSQLYVQEAGVRIPGLNTAPFHAEAPEVGTTGLASLWPTMSFWPIGLALLVVWSCYAFVVVQVFRLVSTSRNSHDPRMVAKRKPF